MDSTGASGQRLSLSRVACGNPRGVWGRIIAYTHLVFEVTTGSGCEQDAWSRGRGLARPWGICIYTLGFCPCGSVLSPAQ